MKKSVIFVADDLGLTKEVNKGILESFKKGVVRNAALLANGDAFENAVEIIKNNSDLEISCHLTVSFGKPVLKKVNTLTDKKGCFIKRNGFDPNFKPSPKELFEEFEAQIEKIINRGIKVVGINCHHNIQLYPGVREAFIKIAKKYKQPIRNVDMKISKNELGNIVSIYGNQSFYNDNSTLEEIERIFLNMKIGEIIDIQTHPGYNDKNLERISSYSHQREKELILLCSTELRKMLKKHNIFLTNYKKT